MFQSVLKSNRSRNIWRRQGLDNGSLPPIVVLWPPRTLTFSLSGSGSQSFTRNLPRAPAGHRLPGIDGLQLITRIKATHPAVAIIAMAAYGTSESAVEARRCGADDYLVKPFEMPDLLRAIHRALDQQKSPAHGGATSTLTQTQQRGNTYGR